ncbi:MAG: hypothetical protein KKH68_14720, partial [Proteobacteria bacterium]|nr:hypothetical protein [Pseudomonadota bacterium]
MKILNIRFKNINTFKGEWEIDFDRSPLKESGLFAITGPNGSGKSTIFDVISLGLYGETFRLKNSPEQILSKQTLDCYAMVTFSSNSGVFRSIWSLRCAKGKPLAPEMRLVELNGNERVLEDKIGTVRSRITELTGLDFKRFSRSVMLPQGEFAALLNALDNERAEILEKIVGPDIYAQFSKAALANAEKESNKLISLKEGIQTFPPPHLSQVEMLRETIEQLEDDFRRAEHAVSALKEKEQQLKSCYQLQKEYEEKQIDLENARARKAQQQIDLLHLKKAMDAALFAEDLEQLDRRKASVSECSNTLEKLDAEITDLQDRLEALRQKGERYGPGSDQDQKAVSDRYEDGEETRKIEQKIEALNSALQYLVEQRLSIENKQKTTRQQQVENRQAMAENQARLKHTQTWLKEHAGDETLINTMAAFNAVLAQLKSVRQEISAQSDRREPALTAGKKTSVLLEKTTRKLKKLFNKAEKLKARHAEQERELTVLLDGTTLEELEKTFVAGKEQLANYRSMFKITKAYAKLKTGDDQALETIQQRYDDLRKQLEQEQLILAAIKHVARFETCRNQLKHREHCPLCGSPDHPYVAGGPPFGRESRQVLRAQEQKLAGLNKQVQTLSDQIAGLKDRYGRLTQIRSQWDRFRQATRTEWALGDPKTVVAAIRALKKYLRMQYRQIKKIRKHVKKTAKFDQAFQKISAQFAAKQTAAQTLQGDLDRYGKTLTALQQKAQTLRQKEAELLQTLQRHLAALNETIPGPGTEEQLKRRLEEKRIDFVNHVNMQQALNELISALTNKAADLVLELDRLQRQADDLDKQEAELLQRILSHKRKLKQAIQITLRSLRTECEALEQDLLNRAAVSGFGTLEDLRNSLLPPEQRQDLLRKQESVDREI